MWRERPARGGITNSECLGSGSARGASDFDGHKQLRERGARGFGRSRTSGTPAPHGYNSGVMALAASSCVAFRRATVRSFPRAIITANRAGRHSLSGQHYAGAVDQRACFHLFFRGEVPQQPFGSGFGEGFIGSRVAFAQFHQQPADSFIRQKFFYRGGIGLKRVGEDRRGTMWQNLSGCGRAA